MKHSSASARVVVTTREGPVDPVLARRLRPLGFQVVSCPAVRRVGIANPPGAAGVVRRWGSYDWVVFTSAAAAGAFLRFARSRGFALRGRGVPRVASVGPATARAVRSGLGWRSIAAPGVFTGAALARAIPDVRGRRMLIPRALEGREELPRILRRRGAAVDLLPLYRTMPDRRGLAALRRRVLAGRAGWVLFASPSAADFALRALGSGGRRLLGSRVLVAAIGPSTARALFSRGVRPAATASPSTVAGLAEALVRYHRRSHAKDR